jgi:sigma-B regulation protein RsbU (phosphoserine phosphatase)
MVSGILPNLDDAPALDQVRMGKIQALRLLNQTARRMNSILELDNLLDHVVDDVVVKFGCLESCILLQDHSGEDLVLAATRGCSLHRRGYRFKIGKDGIVGQVAATGRTRYTPDVMREPRYIPCNVNVRSEVDIPLYVNGRLIGVFCAARSDPDGFPTVQLELLHELAGHIAVAVENARRFQQERADKEELHTRQQEARVIQQALFPKTAPVLPGFEVIGSCVPAEAVAGDWYDYIPLAGGHWGLVVGDVCGKGMAAALTMSATRTLVRSLAERCDSPGELLARINRLLMEDLPEGRFVTMVFAVLDPVSRTLTYANAGHPWPLLVNGDSYFLRSTSGMALGIADCKFDESCVTLPKHSQVLLYSDGITEARNANGEDYGMKRLCAYAAKQELSTQSILDEVRAFSRDGTLADDATMIVVTAN